MDTITDYIPCKEDVFICSIGGEFRKWGMSKIINRGGEFISPYMCGMRDRNPLRRFLPIPVLGNHKSLPVVSSPVGTPDKCHMA